MDLRDNVDYMLNFTAKKYPDKRWTNWAFRFTLGIDRSAKTTNSLFQKTVFKDTPIEWASAFGTVKAWHRSINLLATEEDRERALKECEKALTDFFECEKIPLEHYKL